MHFEITASNQAIRKPLTTAQRNSSLFSEAPRIGGKTLRRGQTIKFDETQFRANEVMLKRLFDAGAVEIVQVDGKSRNDLRKQQVEGIRGIPADQVILDESMDFTADEEKSKKELEAAALLDEAKARELAAIPPPPPAAPEVPVEVPPPAPVLEEASPVQTKNEAFPTPEELQAAVVEENKQTDEQIEKAVETLTPVEEVPPPPPSAPEAVKEHSGKHESSSKGKGKKGKS